MTYTQALRLLTSGYLNIQAISKDMYSDDVSDNTKRMRLAWRIKQGSIGELEISFLEKILQK